MLFVELRQEVMAHLDVAKFYVLLLQIIQNLPYVHYYHTPSPLAEVTSYPMINSTASYFLTGTFSRK